MSALEQRYRSALRWYPAHWRAENADAVLGTLLDVADAERRESPTRFELVDLAFSGVRTRLSPLARVLPSSVRDRAASVALGFGFGLAVVMLVLQEWAPWAEVTEPISGTIVGPFAGWGGALYSAWVLAFLMYAARMATAGRLLLLATVPFSIALVMVDGGMDAAFRPTSYGLAILGSLAVITAMGRPLVGRASWIPVSLVAVYAASSVVVPFLANLAVETRISPREMWNFVSLSQGPFAWLIYVIAAIAVGGVVTRQFSWAGAMMVVSLPIVLISLVMLIDQNNPGLLVLSTLTVVGVLGAIVFWRAYGLGLQVVRRD